MNGRITIADLLQAKRERRRIVAVSYYDYTTARLLAKAQADMLLVGDSAAQFMLGHDSTLPAALNFMVTITAAVRRAAPELFLVADMPFLSYQTGTADAIRHAGRFLVEAGAQMVKIEGTAAEVSQIITGRSPVPVIGCGSGPGCDGQILVAPDILGLSPASPPKFAKAYGDLGAQCVAALRGYAEDVRMGSFPDAGHSCHMKPGESDRLHALLDGNT